MSNEPQKRIRSRPNPRDIDYRLKHAFFELLQLRSILTLMYSAVFLWMLATGKLESWDKSVAAFGPMVTMILMNYFKKDKGE